jgi:hypothetical protein
MHMLDLWPCVVSTCPQDGMLVLKYVGVGT